MQKNIKRCSDAFLRFWRRSRWHKTLVIAAAIGVFILASMYGIARWYIAQNNHKPMVYGVSFIPAYADSLGLDPQETMDALINDTGVRHFRLVSYWSQLEPEQGKYDFSLLDWQFEKAEAAGAKVTLSLGLRQPRWPECHLPDWAKTTDGSVRQPELETFMTAVVNRYKNSPALESYQVENEFFLKGFGLCTNFDRQRLVREYALVKRLDPHHTVIVNRSNNALGIPLGKPQPEKFGISIYKRTWGNPPGRYVEYPFPAWYYAFVAGVQKIVTGKDMMVHELQTEAWAPQDKRLSEISLEEQNKSFNAWRFEDRLKFVEGTGMREVYLWGAEYWYYRVVHENDYSVWNVAKEHFRSHQHPNTK